MSTKQELYSMSRAFLLPIFSILFTPCYIFGQNYVDALYSFETVFDVSYGASVDFAGSSQELLMDISQPIDDTVPACGRPLMVIVHGGAWSAGSKGDEFPTAIREDFAERGYTTASITYRLGLFNTDQEINCNIPLWNCFNMTDTSEWYRANFRGVQDLNGAIRFLINEADTYHINPENIFLVGESAGGFIVIGSGFIDDTAEVSQQLTGEYSDAPAPHPIYDVPCVQEFGLATSIDDMDLSRPNLGSYEGSLNLDDSLMYQVKGVGSFYGGAFSNIFESQSEAIPSLYMFHQPCDLIVPYAYDRLLAGVNDCAMGFPAYCGSIVNRPFVYGSMGIKNSIDQLNAEGLLVPDYVFETTTNNFPCIVQVNNPEQACHGIDNYNLRTANMAEFFASKLDSCILTSSTTHTPGKSEVVNVYPNPVKAGSVISVDFKSDNLSNILFYDFQGQLLMKRGNLTTTQLKAINISQLGAGSYVMLIQSEEKIAMARVVVN